MCIALSAGFEFKASRSSAGSKILAGDKPVGEITRRRACRFLVVNELWRWDICAVNCADVGHAQPYRSSSGTIK